MLQIKHLRIEIETSEGLFGFDTKFKEGLNIIASDDNTRGKTSVVESILYCLGCEEILGGQGAKVLTPVYTTELTDDKGNSHQVLQSGSYLEISNGRETITIFRAVKSQSRKEKLITIFKSNLNDIRNSKTKRKDYYVLSQGAASNQDGYHTFLNEFLALNLPTVYDNNDNPHQLYIQQILAALFIEQKGGWIDILNRAPYFGISQVKRRVMEYWLGIDTNKAEHERRVIEKQIIVMKEKWKHTIREMQLSVEEYGGQIINVSSAPEIMTKQQIDSIQIMIEDQAIEDYVKSLQEKLHRLISYSPKVKANYDSLQRELQSAEEKIVQLHNELKNLQERKHLESQNIRTQEHILEQITNDIQNNKDANKLKNLGSKHNLRYANDRCPLCNQDIEDCLLPFETPIMSIDDNIAHLTAQKNLIEFSVISHKKVLKKIETTISVNEQALFSIEKLALSLRSDILSIEGSYSEAVVRQKVDLQNNIVSLNSIIIKLKEFKDSIYRLSEEWRELIAKQDGLQTQDTRDAIIKQLKRIKNQFIDYLYKFGFKSVSDKKRIDISSTTLLPSIDEFDMKFGTSASDNVRMIWAYTLSVLIASKQIDHSLNFALFDEPKQHSIIKDDVDAFIDAAIEICNNNNFQIIFCVTAKDESKLSVEKAKTKGIHVIEIFGRAFKSLD